MKAVFVQTGHSIDYTPTANVAAGDVIVVGDLIGVAKFDIPANCLGALAIVGCFDVEKAEAAVFAFGDKVYWDNSAKVATDVATANTYMGKAIAAAAAAADGVNPAVRLALNAPGRGATGATGGVGGVGPQGPAGADAEITPALAIVDLTIAAAAGADYTKSELDTAFNAIKAKLNAVLAALRTTGVVAPNA
ncbi:MAG: DUF2190 family protein [Lentisphaerota bacterium]